MKHVKRITMAFALLLGLVAQSANAALIDQGDSTLDDVNNLEWLDVSLTDGMTVSAALAAYEADGWELATETQYHGLFNDFFTIYNDADGNGVQTVHDGVDQVLYDQSLVFASLFGLTYEIETASASYGFYVDETTGDLHLGGTFLGSTWSNLYGDYPVAYATPNTSVGIFLVRATSVPEASTLAMLAIGLLGLGFARRKA